MSEQDDTLIYGLEGANYAAGYAEGEQERDRLQSELDRLKADVEPVLRAAEDCLNVARTYALGEVDMALQRHLAVTLSAFRQQHPKED